MKADNYRLTSFSLKLRLGVAKFLRREFRAQKLPALKLQLRPIKLYWERLSVPIAIVPQLCWSTMLFFCFHTKALNAVDCFLIRKMKLMHKHTKLASCAIEFERSQVLAICHRQEERVPPLSPRSAERLSLLSASRESNYTHEKLYGKSI